MFIGEYQHNIDDKSRMVLPSKFRYELGENFIITRGLEGCLFIYPESNWILLVKKLNTLPFTKRDARAFTRFFLSGASYCTFDKQGRILVPPSLVNYASLKKECIVIGVNDRIEVWSKEKYDEFLKENENNISDLAEKLFDNVDF